MSDNKELEMLQDGTKVSPETDDMGSIHVDDEVLSIVAGLAASEVPGVYGMSGGIRGGINEMLGKQNFSKGIKVFTEGRTVRVEVHVIITYGYNIPDVAIKLQEKVKDAVENMAGYEVTAVDIHVEGIRKDKMEGLSGKGDIDTLEERYKEAAREEASLKQEMKDPEGKGADSSAKEQNEETVSQEASGVNA